MLIDLPLILHSNSRWSLVGDTEKMIFIAPAVSEIEKKPRRIIFMKALLNIGDGARLLVIQAGTHAASEKLIRLLTHGFRVGFVCCDQVI